MSNKKLSKQGIELLKKLEGFSERAYKNSGEQYYTIGYGHYSRSVEKGQTISRADAEKLLKNDLKRFEKAVNNINAVGMYGFGQAKFDALVLFAYNLGVGSLQQLTANCTRSDKLIYEKMEQYNKCGGKVLKGLVKRRNIEKNLFKNGKYEV